MERAHVSLLRKQESRFLMPSKFPSPGLAEGQAGLSTARGEAVCFIRLNRYPFRRSRRQGSESIWRIGWQRQGLVLFKGRKILYLVQHKPERRLVCNLWVEDGNIVCG